MADRSTCPRTPTNRRHALGATAVALSLLADACSSDADGRATSSTTAGDGGAADTAEAEGPPSATFAWQVPEGALDDAVEQLPAIVETADDEIECHSRRIAPQDIGGKRTRLAVDQLELDLAEMHGIGRGGVGRRGQGRAEGKA